jgi:hypothetical protein
MCDYIHPVKCVLCAQLFGAGGVNLKDMEKSCEIKRLVGGGAGRKSSVKSPRRMMKKMCAGFLHVFFLPTYGNNQDAGDGVHNRKPIVVDNPFVESSGHGQKHQLDVKGEIPNSVSELH